MKILIINGHPDKESFCFSLAQEYKKGAEKSGATCKLLNLTDLQFNPILKYGYRKRTELEPDLLLAQKEILQADHLVFIYPTWWGTFPALLHGFIDRVFLPGFAFKYHGKSIFWDKLLKGKTARLIVTMDSPAIYYSFMLGKPGQNAMEKAILEFCGIKPVKITTFRIIKSSSEEKRLKWLSIVKQLGEKNK